jgi:hypothetical protein
MIPVETTPGIEDWGIKKKSRGCEFMYIWYIVRTCVNATKCTPTQHNNKGGKKTEFVFALMQGHFWKQGGGRDIIRAVGRNLERFNTSVVFLLGYFPSSRSCLGCIKVRVSFL